MKIKIYEDETQKKYFEFDDEPYEFNYDSFKKLIEKFYDNNEEYSFECAEELNEYKNLIDEIIIESRSDDFRNALETAIKDAEMVQEEVE